MVVLQHPLFEMFYSLELGFDWCFPESALNQNMLETAFLQLFTVIYEAYRLMKRENAGIFISTYSNSMKPMNAHPIPSETSII
mgnify:CR=1 FL=1